MHKQVLIDWQYWDENGRNERAEKAALNKLLKASVSFDDAKFTYNAALNSIFDRYDIMKSALALALTLAKTFDDYIFVAVNSERGTPQYAKAIERAEHKAKNREDIATVARINKGGDRT